MSHVLDKNKLPGDEASIKEIPLMFWRGKCLIAAVSLGLTATGGLAAWIVPKSNMASSIAPLSSSSGGGPIDGLGVLASQIGGLALLAGVSVSGDSKPLQPLSVTWQWRLWQFEAL